MYFVAKFLSNYCVYSVEGAVTGTNAELQLAKKKDFFCKLDFYLYHKRNCQIYSGL